MLLENGDMDVKMAGVNNFHTGVGFDEINITDEHYLVKRAYRCKGGTLIMLENKHIKVPDKYKEVYKQNENKII